MRRFLIIPLLLACSPKGGAEQSAATPDFSGAFVKLAALGMPVLDSQAKWAVISGSNSSDYQFRQLAKSLKGNGWLLSSGDGKFRAIPLGGLEVIETDSSQARPPTTFPDLSKDVGILISALTKAAAKKDDDDPYSNSSRGSESGNLLLFATQLHQTGHPELANRLALAAFAVFPERESAVDAAIDRIASHAYQQAAGDFFKSGDWAAYHRSLVGLVDRFPRGWMARDAIRMFLPQVEKQASGVKPPVPSLQDIPIDPQALEIILELTEKTHPDPNQPSATMSPELRHRMQMMESMGGYHGGRSDPPALWLIADPAEPPENASPHIRLTRLKMAALPALAALASDPFLTHLPNLGARSVYYSSEESSEERTLRAYASLNRPATRGEIAGWLLAATLPDPENELSEADPATLGDLAISFWKEHKNATREDLAAVFLRDGSRDQSARAATILASSADPRAHQVFESHILAAEDALGAFQQVGIYLRTRRAAAKPFFEAYANRVRSQSADASGDEDDYNPNSWMIKEAGGVEKILKQLESLVGTQSPRALAVQIAKGKSEDAEAAIKSLSALLTEASPTKHLFTLLEGANAATDPVVRARFLDATISIRRPEDENNEGAPSPERAVSDPEAKVWRKLIADTREIPGDLNRFQRAEKSTVAELAASSFEYSVSPIAYSEAAQAAPILSKPVTTLIREQAEARLSGKPVPPLPDASRVSRERLIEIIAETAKKPPAEIQPHLKTLAPDERAAWIQWIEDPGEISVPSSVKDLRFLVVGRADASIMGYPDAGRAGDIDTGFALSPATLKSHVEALAADVSKHSRTVTYVKNAAFGPGLEAFTISIPLPTNEPENEAESRRQRPNVKSVFGSALRVLADHESAEGVIMASFSTANHHESAIWLIEAGKAKPVDAEKQASLDAAFQAAAENSGFPRLALAIQTLSKTDSDAIRDSDSDN